MKLLATRETYYAGRTYRAGEVFDVRDKHAKTLRQLKHCADAPVTPAEPVPDLQAEAVPPMTTENAGAIAPNRRGRYARRDERAEDTPTADAAGQYARRDMRPADVLADEAT